MTERYLDLEQSKLRELEKDFSSKGYKVLVRPGLFDLPEFLRDIPAPPDLLATSPDDNVIVEIKSRKSIKSDTQLAKLAEAVNAHEKWSFMLVYTNPKTKHQIRPESSHNIANISSLVNFIKEADATTESDETRKAHFLLLWAAFEAAASSALEKESFQTKKKSTFSLIRDAAMAGLISRTDSQKLEDLHKKRNELSHGALDTKVSQGNINKLISVCEELVVR